MIDQRRIAKNALLLYLRMAVVMFIGLYTSRVILDALGEVDFGLYTTVGGIVVMFGFLSSAMSTACERFYAYEIGRGDSEGLNHVFSMCVTVFAVIAAIVVILCETVGIWLLYRKLDVAGRMGEAMWVFQISMVSFLFTILKTPFLAMVTIKEKMKVIAYVSIVEVCGNLAIALLLTKFPSGRLILYSVLMLAVNVCVTLYYVMYCLRFYPECRYRFYWDRAKFREIFSFAGWGMFGSAATVCQNQGVNILLDIFFGPAINAARGMAYKVYATLRQFVDNFIVAFRPQILKSYSEGDRGGMLSLVCQSSKFSYFLMYAISLPFVLEMPAILDVWLKNVPAYTALFARLALANTLVDVMITPLNAAMQAYGKIRNYQIVTCSMFILILPVSYLFLRLGFPAECVYYVSIALSIVAAATKLWFTRNCVGLSVRKYVREVFLPVTAVSVVSALIPFGIWISMGRGFLRFVLVVCTSLAFTALSVYFLGMTSRERKHAREFLLEKIRFAK